MAKICRQIKVVVPDAVGKLAEVTGKIKAAGVNINAMVAWVHEGKGHLLLVSDDAEKACQAVKPVVEKCEFGEVVCTSIPNKAGTLNAAATILSQSNIGIKMAYATAGSGDKVTLVLDTQDNAKAAKLL